MQKYSVIDFNHSKYTEEYISENKSTKNALTDLLKIDTSQLLPDEYATTIQKIVEAKNELDK